MPRIVHERPIQFQLNIMVPSLPRTVQAVFDVTILRVTTLIAKVHSSTHRNMLEPPKGKAVVVLCCRRVRHVSHDKARTTPRDMPPSPASGAHVRHLTLLQVTGPTRNV